MPRERLLLRFVEQIEKIDLLPRAHMQICFLALQGMD